MTEPIYEIVDTANANGSFTALVGGERRPIDATAEGAPVVALDRVIEPAAADAAA